MCMCVLCKTRACLYLDHHLNRSRERSNRLATNNTLTNPTAHVHVCFVQNESMLVPRPPPEQEQGEEQQAHYQQHPNKPNSACACVRCAKREHACTSTTI